MDQKKIHSLSDPEWTDWMDGRNPSIQYLRRKKSYSIQEYDLDIDSYLDYIFIYYQRVYIQSNLPLQYQDN